MARIGRRKFFKLTGAGALAAKTGGIAAILAAGRAPAYAQGVSVHWLRWNDFIPASDELLKKEIAPAAEKALGFKLNIETINGNDLQARTTSAIQSGSGPDVICGLNNWPQLYAESVADVSDLAEEIGKAQGGYYDESKVVANDGKKWIAVPWCVLGAMIVYRKSWFEEIGLSKFPETWEQYREAGKKLKAKGQTARPDARPHLRRRADLQLSLSLVLGRQGGRGRRQDRGAQLQGGGRLRQVHDGVLEGRS